MTARLSHVARTIRDSGGTVVMRRTAGHDSPWAYMAGDVAIEYGDVIRLELQGVLTRIEPGIAGCERCEFVIADETAEARRAAVGAAWERTRIAARVGA